MLHLRGMRRAMRPVRLAVSLACTQGTPGRVAIQRAHCVAPWPSLRHITADDITHRRRDDACTATDHRFRSHRTFPMRLPMLLRTVCLLLLLLTASGLQAQPHPGPGTELAQVRTDDGQKLAVWSRVPAQPRGTILLVHGRTQVRCPISICRLPTSRAMRARCWRHWRRPAMPPTRSICAAMAAVRAIAAAGTRPRAPWPMSMRC